MASKSNQLDGYEEMREAFHLFDREQEGVIKAEGIQKLFAHIGCDLTLEDCDVMVKECDRSRNGVGIEFEDFVKLMQRGKEDLHKGNIPIDDYEKDRIALLELQAAIETAPQDQVKHMQEEIDELKQRLPEKKKKRDKQIYQGPQTRYMLSYAIR